MPSIVIAPDSFKESLSAAEVAQAIAQGWHHARPQDLLILHPMADGGEGTADTILNALNGEKRTCNASDPLGNPVHAPWCWLPDSHTAVIEMACASGLHLVPPNQRNPLHTSTYGTGQLILAALDAGAQTIILTLGGSATNDGGCGMLSALGLQLLDRNHQPLPAGGAALAQLATIGLDTFDSRLKHVRFIAACDVSNPLCGPQGASAVFGPQKGASASDVAVLDHALAHFADICHHTLAVEHRNTPGAGAAGGLGFAALTFLNARLRPGVELVAELTGLEQSLRGADLVITGEGQLDAQTLHGKTPIGVARLAQAQHIPVIALAGSLQEGYQQLYQHGITAAFSIAPGPVTLDYAYQHVRELLQQRAADIARLWTLQH